MTCIHIRILPTRFAARLPRLAARIVWCLAWCLAWCLVACLVACCVAGPGSAQTPKNPPPTDRPYVVVLGVAQDGGYPHPGCKKECCKRVWTDANAARMVSCIAVVDPTSHQRWVFDATPDFPHQIELLDQFEPPQDHGIKPRPPLVDGVFLTHAHIGHYTGLMYLGKEALGADRVPVYGMPRMREFLSNDGPWSQLVTQENIALRPLEADRTEAINDRITVTPLVVPHRDEFSETVAFVIRGPNKSALFLPDIDKWSKWGTRIEQAIADVDIAFLDGTFFDNEEIPNRDMSQIPHPFIVESVKRFEALPKSERSKVHFIHLNHSNPALMEQSEAAKFIRSHGMHVANQSGVYEL